MQTLRSKKTAGSQRSATLTSFGILGVAFFFLGFLRVATSVPTEHVYTATTAPQVLGDSQEDKSEEKENEQEKKQAEKQREDVKKQEERKNETEKKETSTERFNTQSKETEIETAEGLKVKTKIEDDGRTKVEIEQKKLKFKMETQPQKVATQGAREVEMELEDEVSDHEDVLRISTDSGHPSLTRRSIKANSDFPLSVDPTTNSLMITTPEGTKTVSVLPDQAVENLLRVGFISTTSANLSSASAQIRLTEKDGKAVYRVEAKKRFKLFGVVDLETPTTVTISAEDGQVITQERSLLTEIVDFFSP